MNNQDDRLLAYSCMLCGAVAGALVALPVALQQGGISAPLLLAAGLTAGILIGHRRRRSRGFLYFCLFVILTLLTLIQATTRWTPPTT